MRLSTSDLDKLRPTFYLSLFPNHCRLLVKLALSTGGGGISNTHGRAESLNSRPRSLAYIETTRNIAYRMVQNGFRYVEPFICVDHALAIHATKSF